MRKCSFSFVPSFPSLFIHQLQRSLVSKIKDFSCHIPKIFIPNFKDFLCVKSRFMHANNPMFAFVYTAFFHFLTGRFCLVQLAVQLGIEQLFFSTRGAQKYLRRRIVKELLVLKILLCTSKFF